MMRIIHLVLGKANPQRMNGVNKVVHEMATVQVEAGYDVEVWGISSDLQHNYPQRNFRTKLFLKSKNPFKLSKLLKDALSSLNENCVVHMHGAFIPVFYTASTLLYKKQTPFVLTPHSSYNLVMMQKNAWVKNIYVKLFETSLLKRAGRIHLVGSSELEGLKKIDPTQKGTLIPYGFKRSAISKPSKPVSDNFIIGYCGRLDIFSKGLDTLLSGFAKFYSTHKNAVLVIIGDGVQKAALLQMTKKLGIEQAVEWKGALYAENKLSALNACHLFAHPSRTDGLPATIVEAASIGLPCLVTKETNMGDYVKQYDAGYVMNNADAQELAAGLDILYERIIINKDLEKLKKNAISMIDEAFNWNILLKDFDAMYFAAQKKSKRTESRMKALV